MRAVGCIALVALLGQGCSGRADEQKASTASPKSTSKVTKKKTRGPDEKPASRPDAPIGVESCDRYLARYSACLEQKVPARVRAGMERQVAATRQEWLRAAGQPGGKKQLARACKTAYEAAAASMKQFGCTW